MLYYVTFFTVFWVQIPMFENMGIWITFSALKSDRHNTDTPSRTLHMMISVDWRRAVFYIYCFIILSAPGTSYHWSISNKLTILLSDSYCQLQSITTWIWRKLPYCLVTFDNLLPHKCFWYWIRSNYVICSQTKSLHCCYPECKLSYPAAYYALLPGLSEVWTPGYQDCSARAPDFIYLCNSSPASTLNYVH